MEENLLDKLRGMMPASEPNIATPVEAIDPLLQQKEEFLNTNLQVFIQELEAKAIEAAQNKLNEAVLTRTVDPGDESKILKHTIEKLGEYFEAKGFHVELKHSNNSNYFDVIERGYEPHAETEVTRGVLISW